MMNKFEGLPFRPADILIPAGCEMELWSVVACDQYTSQPEYWSRVDKRVGGNPSSLRLVLPESRLKEPDIDGTISEINGTMERYLRQGLFHTYKNALVYVERTLESGRIRRGLVGMVDLEAYDYRPGAEAMIRATEGTVLERIPPRIAVREHALLELPHVMMLMDDPEKLVLEPLAGETDEMVPVYDFELMEQGGHIRGWLLNENQKSRVAEALWRLAEPSEYRRRYGLPDDARLMLFAVGDGNHSLATAKACWEGIKKTNPVDRTARYTLVELENLHDEALEFEPIHRVAFGVDPEELLSALHTYYPLAEDGEQKGHVLHWHSCGRSGSVTICRPEAQLAVGTLQNFLDDYILHREGASLDYVHGEEEAVRLSERPDALAFLLPAMKKEELFPGVIRDGALPRKTFSMGKANEKRFYLEARKIRD